MRVVVIIPARFASTRLPGKPLALIHGRPMIRHVYERAAEAKGVLEVVVATDDARIAEVVGAFGGRALLTSPACPSGTDRVAEAARSLAAEGLDFEAVVNVQGDEPFLDPGAIGEVAGLLAATKTDGRAPMATLARALEAGEAERPSVVKVACDLEGYALFFSRAPIGQNLAHVGLYAYTRERLEQIAALPVTPLEAAERLEQLRVLEHGLPIAVGRTGWRSAGIDTPEDLLRANDRT